MIIKIEKIICDRCGDEIDIGSFGITSINPHMKIDKACSNGWKPLDICERCEKEFVYWWTHLKEGS